MKTAGVILDFYDDVSGSVLKEVFPSVEDLPDLVKEAHILNPEERDVLRDDAYALVMLNEGRVLRKFACVDPGNTILSMAYFEKVAEYLPEDALGFAASRLSSFCSEFGIEPTELVKIAAEVAEMSAKNDYSDEEGAVSSKGRASGMSRERDSFKQPMAGDEADWAARTNLMSLRGGSDSGRVIPTANQMKTAGLGGGEVLTDDVRDVGVNQKMPPLNNILPSSVGMGTPTVIPGAHPQLVDVTGKEPPVKLKKKTASMYALGERYPLDTYTDVNKAVQYFADYWVEMRPGDRHEYCVKTAARAEELGIETSYMMQRYGSLGYSPDVEAHLYSRSSKAPSEYSGAYEELLEKRASIHPEDFALVLARVDEASGLSNHWGGLVMDPWFSTFGGEEKVASESWKWKSAVGDMVNAEQLRWLATEGLGLVKKQFPQDMAEAFAKDPIQIFESMPDAHKKILCHMANTQFDGPGHN